MDDILKLSREEQRTYFEQAAANLGFSPAIVEKDFWVCWVLRELFSLTPWGKHLTFKGGTSLSKGWQLVKRFSEDVDIVIGRESLGFPGDHSLGNKQIKRLRKACQDAVQHEIATALSETIRNSGLSTALSLESDDTDPDGQTLLLDTLRKGRLRIAPIDSQMPQWEEDYSRMGDFFFPMEAPPPWVEILEAVRAFERRFNETQHP